jgi:8-oxo-dGTP pyrophosphatase MutT (NUDIX family)
MPEETPEDGVLREAWEETGLDGLVLDAYLGRQDRVEEDITAGRTDVQERHFFHLLCTAEPPETWQHIECDPSDGSDPMPFDLFWVPLPHGVPPLAGDQDALLPQLLSLLNLMQ